MNSINYPLKGVDNIARNLFAGGISRVLLEDKPSIRGCLTYGAREIVDSERWRVANGMGEIDSNNELPSSYSRNRSEILGNNMDIAGDYCIENQKETASEVKSTIQEVTQSQRMQKTNGGYMLSGKGNDKTVANGKNGWVFDSTLGYGGNYGKQNDGYRDASFVSYQTDMQGVLKDGDDINRLSAEGNTFWDSVPQVFKDLVQSDAVHSLSVDGMDERWRYKYWEGVLKEIKELNIRQLTGTAAEIMSILSVVMPNPGIAALHIVLGLCVVAQEVQEARRKEKERLEGLGWREPAIKVELDRQVPIWFRNKAMEFFVGEWLGKVTKFITTDKFKRIAIDQGREPFLDYYKRILIAWNEYQEILDARSQIGTWTGIVEEAYKKKQNQGNSGEY